MEALSRLANNVKKLDVDRLLFSILKNKKLQSEIIRLNTQEQLFKKGIDSEGRRLDEIGGGYSDLTIEIKKSKGQPTDRVTLKDTGAFYDSWNIVVKMGEVVIDADPIKDDTNLFDEWGEDIVGLTENSLQVLTDLIRPKLITAVNEAIRKGL